MICDKIPYGSYKEAQAATAHIKSKNGMKSYKCNDCGEFHIATIKISKGTFKIKNKYPIDYTNAKPFKKIKVKEIDKYATVVKQDISIATTYRPFAYLKEK